ncbi:MAG: cytochrome c peroxidase [Myxococcales bacterium]
MAPFSRSRTLLAGCLLLEGVACGDGLPPANQGSLDSGTADGGSDAAVASDAGSDPDPVFSAEVRTTLQSLRYSASPPPADPSNRVAALSGARLFGQRLFFEAALSGRLLERDNDGTPATLGVAGETGRVSCAGCHVPGAGFVDNRSPHRTISLAAQWTRRRTPTLLEIGFAGLYNWDGRRDAIWNQAIGVFESTSEFNSSRLFIAQQIYKLHRAEYEALFGPMPELGNSAKFPLIDASQAGCEAGPVETAKCHGKPGDKAEYDGMSSDAQKAVTTVVVNVAKALAAYVSQLRCGPSRFDMWLDGDTAALTRSEQRGAAVFAGSGGCVSCHSGPNLTDGKFHNVGLRPATVAVAFTDTDDRGAGEGIAAALTDPLNTRGAFSDGDRGVLPQSVGQDLEGAFRTPTLRCVAEQPSYMHTAQLATLEQVVKFFDRGGDQAGYPGTNELHALGLSDQDKADLAAFLGALQGAGPDAQLVAAPSSPFGG